MNEKILKAKRLLEKKDRLDLCFLPTPFYKLENMSKYLGINLYIKRDDFTGKNLFGGNKMRKLEYLLGKAKKQGCKYIFTYGATQSNHAMQTAAAALANGMTPVLYLSAIVEPKKNDLRSNFLLDKIFGARVYLVGVKDSESFQDVTNRSLLLGLKHIKKLERGKEKCYNIPMGGANHIGSTGFIKAFIELQEQLNSMKIDADYLYHATGSGGTLAGLAAGKKLINSNVKIHSIAVLDADKNYKNNVVCMANKSLSWIKSDLKVSKDDFSISRDYFAPGYECPNKKSTKAIKLLAQKEGLLVDPVYTAKALAGLIDHVKNGKIPKNSNVVFWHTGGATALFAEKQILGNLIKE